MNILLIHNKYQQIGGEESVLLSEKSLLSDYGNKVSLEIEENDTIHSFSAKAKTFLNVTYSNKSRKWMLDKIYCHEPDIVHIHNFFPLLTPSIYDACIDENIPVVQTLHNYRTICPGSLLMRNGRVCELCLNGNAYKSILYRCYRDSALGTLAVAHMVEQHKKMRTWENKVNKFIALTDFAKRKFVEAGFPDKKIAVKPNFIASNLTPENSNHNRIGALFVGRLSKEKGIETLIRAWNNLAVPLSVAGTGPLENLFLNLSSNYINFLGFVERKTVQHEMSKAAFLVLPSEWYEGFPMVLVEAFSHGLPVVTSRLGSMIELVENGVTGLYFESNNAEDFAEKVQWMNGHPEECRRMGLNARKVYEQKYTPDKNYEILMDIYLNTIKET